jgi:DNA-binding LytR/AlgR family response regulator
MNSGLAPTAVIADDEAPLREYLRKKLAALWPELRIVAQAQNGVEAAAAIAAHAPAVAFLDIKMPGLTGLEVAQGIETDTRVVFVTAFDQYALDAFEREAVDYLVKPVDSERLARTVERLKRALREAAPAPELARLLDALVAGRVGGPAAGAAGDESGASGTRALRWIRASRGDTTYHVPVQDVLYFQSDDKYTAVHTAAGEHLIRTPLAELAAGLDPQVFWQIHRSTIVNMDHVAATRRDDGGRLFVRFRQGDAELPVSRAYVHRFRQM